MPELLTEVEGTILEAATDTGGSRYRVLCISEGRGSSGVYPRETLMEAARNKLIKRGTFAYLDHPSASKNRDRPERSVRDLAGVFTSDAVWSEEHKGLVAEMRVVGPYRQLVGEMADHIGLSIRGDGEIEMREGQRTITSLAHPVRRLRHPRWPRRQGAAAAGVGASDPRARRRGAQRRPVGRVEPAPPPRQVPGHDGDREHLRGVGADDAGLCGPLVKGAQVADVGATGLRRPAGDRDPLEAEQVSRLDLRRGTPACVCRRERKSMRTRMVLSDRPRTLAARYTYSRRLISVPVTMP